MRGNIVAMGLKGWEKLPIHTVEGSSAVAEDAKVAVKPLARA